MRNAVVSGLMATCIAAVAIHANALAGGDKGSGRIAAAAGSPCSAAPVPRMLAVVWSGRVPALPASAL